MIPENPLIGLPEFPQPLLTGGFRSDWGANLFAGVRSVIGTAARCSVGAYQAIQQTLRGQVTLYPS